MDGAVCEGHAAVLPFDLLYRLRLAYDEGDRMEQTAALHAVHEYLRSS